MTLNSKVCVIAFASLEKKWCETKAHNIAKRVSRLSTLA